MGRPSLWRGGPGNHQPGGSCWEAWHLLSYGWQRGDRRGLRAQSEQASRRRPPPWTGPPLPGFPFQVVTCGRGGNSCHHGLMNDLVGDGVHELRGQGGQLDEGAAWGVGLM